MMELASATIAIPQIAILESVAIAKAFAGGKTVDASQEMIALGFCNIFDSFVSFDTSQEMIARGFCNIFGLFVSSMPTTGSFSRTAVNSASGVKTPLGGLFTGSLVILCLTVLIPFCAFIPFITTYYLLLFS